ncbi:MAG: response regulator transcription factor [Rhodocyclaceae bacterium]|jgi:two-component system response regulator QseB|nr:MAG: response regulator transcription factor [Rhodocyclaceae bacterium]
MHILIVEDDVDLGRGLLTALKPEGFSAVWLRRLADLPAQDEAAFDCALVDLTLPDGDGLSLLRRWRTSGRGLPVIVITARSTLEDRLAGLDGGADDFMVKPFAMPELVARIRAVTRRYAQQASALWRIGELEIEPQAHLARLGGVAVELSPREFRLLVELARDPGTVVSKTVLGQRLEPLGDPLDAPTIEVHVSNLRRKIGAGLVRTVRGVGYQLVA